MRTPTPLFWLLLAKRVTQQAGHRHRSHTFGTVKSQLRTDDGLVGHFCSELASCGLAQTTDQEAIVKVSQCQRLGSRCCNRFALKLKINRDKASNIVLCRNNSEVGDRPDVEMARHRGFHHRQCYLTPAELQLGL